MNAGICRKKGKTTRELPKKGNTSGSAQKRKTPRDLPRKGTDLGICRKKEQGTASILEFRARIVEANCRSGILALGTTQD
eukprot:4832146-Pleurochrysis_carterae.AAC.1